MKNSAIRVPSFFRETTTSLADECALSGPVAIAISSAVHSPFAWNFGTPTIALPLTSETWTKEELEMVLRHELVHLKRQDSISALLVGMVTTLHWFNPLAWRVAKHVSELREQICDRNVLAAGCDPQKYAGLLFHQARAKSAPYPFSATAMAKPGTLEKRVSMILKETSPLKTADGTQASMSRRILASIGATCLLAISAAVILLGFSPKSSIAEETGNTKLTIHVYSEDAGKQQLGYELNGEEIKGEALSSALKKEAKKNPVLALVQAAPVSLGGLQETMNLAKKAGFSHFIFQKREVKRAGAHFRPISALAGIESTRTVVVPKKAQNKKQIHITTRFVEEPSPLMKKLNTLILPSIELNETPLEDAIAFISQRSVELDSQTTNVEEKGVNFVMKGPPKSETHLVSLTMKSVSIAQIIKIIAHQMQMEVRVDEHAVMLRYTGVPGGAFHPLLGHDPESEKQIKAKLKSIRIPSVEFADTPLRDALEFLTQRSIELDAKTADVDLKGVNIVAENASKELDKSISLKLNNIPLEDAIRYTTDLADMDYRVEGNAVVVFKKEGGNQGFGFDAGGGGFEGGGAGR